MSCMNKSYLVEYEENDKTNIESPTLFDTVKLWLVRFAMDRVDNVFLDRRKFMKMRPHDLVDVNTTRMENVINVSQPQPQSKVLMISPFNLLAFLSVLLMKFVGFQLNLLLTFLTFPIWSFNLLIYPFRALRARGYYYLVKKLLRVLGVSRIKLAYRLGCGLLWSSYVFVMLLGLLASGFVFSGLLVRNIIEKPVETREILNFDYTKTTPVAYVPISGLLNHNNLHLLVSLTVPESDYNRQLGVFQALNSGYDYEVPIVSLEDLFLAYRVKWVNIVLMVKVEVVSTRGEVTANSSKACILEFRSQAIRIAKTLIKSAPLVAGFVSESQILNINMQQLTVEQQTAYVKVMIESRAEYRLREGAGNGNGNGNGNGIGIPQIYEAYLSLHSHHFPILQTLIWNWRRTLFIWISFFVFFAQLIFILLFFTPLRVRGRSPKAKQPSVDLSLY